MKAEYVCLDFETANQSLTSACSIGLVGVVKDNVIFEKHYLINPEEEFQLQNIYIHKITPEMVKDSPKFYEIWDEIKELINDSVVVAHNAIFDVMVLKSVLLKYNLEFPKISIACTLLLSRIAFTEIPNHKLNTISSYLQVGHNHHNALSDSYICYEIIKRCKRMYQVYDIYDLYEINNLALGYLDQKSYRPCQKKVTSKIKHTQTNVLNGFVISSTGKPKTFTKSEFRNMVNNNGGLYAKQISLAINCFVIFDNPKKEHLYVLSNLKEKRNIQIINETEFLDLIHDSRI